MLSTKISKAGAVRAVVVLTTLLAPPALTGVRIGVEIGANSSSLRYEHLDAFPEMTSHWGPAWPMSLTGGASVEIPWRRHVSMITGLRYVEQGNRVKLDSPPGA